MIRRARPEDSVQAAPLLAAAWGGLALAVTGAETHAEAVQSMGVLFTGESSRLSYRNALVDEREDVIVGVLVAYHGRDEAALVQPMRDALRARTNNPASSIEAEAMPDEYYLDTVSVRADWQGRGVGSGLLQAIEQQARHLGHAKLSLLVDAQNDGARRLYERTGYRADGTRLLAGHIVTHMVKRLSLP